MTHIQSWTTEVQLQNTGTETEMQPCASCMQQQGFVEIFQNQ